MNVRQTVRNLLHKATHPATEAAESQVDPTEAAIVDAEAFNRSALLALGAHNFIGMTAEPSQPSGDSLSPVAQETPMSTAATVPAVVKPSFFARFKAEIVHLFSHAPAWTSAAISTITYVAPLVDLVLDFVDPAVVPVVDAILVKVRSALTAAQVVLKDGGTSPSLLTYLQSINTNIAQVEAAAQIKDPAIAAKLTALVATITGEVNAIIAEATAAKA